MGLLIHPDILSKVNCAETSHTAPLHPRRLPPTGRVLCQAHTDVLVFEHHSQVRGSKKWEYGETKRVGKEKTTERNDPLCSTNT